MRVLKEAIKRTGRLAALLLLGAAAASAQELTPSGTVTTIAGYLEGFTDGDNSVSQFRNPWGLTVGPNGTLYIADFGNNAIRTLNPANNVVGRISIPVGLNGPRALAMDPSGNLVIVNFTGGSVVRFTTAGGFVGNVATGLPSPTAVAVDFEGKIYVSILGGAVRQYESDGTLGTVYIAPFGSQLQGVAIMADGSVVASDSANDVLWKWAAAGGAPTVFAGTRGAAGFANGALNEARFNDPHQIAIAKNNSIVVADRGNNRVRIVDFSGNVSTLYGGDPSEWAGTDPMFLPGWRDGAAASAWVRDPVGVVATGDGTVYGSELYYDIIRKAAGLNYPTNTGGGGTGPLPGAERNTISLGFAGGEASSQFKGSPGQRFFAPVVLKIQEDQKMYGLQFNLTITNNTPPATSPVPPTGYGPWFDSSLLRPLPDGTFEIIPPRTVSGFTARVELVTNIVAGLEVVTPRLVFDPNWASLLVTNTLGNFMGVGWLERFNMTNLYDTRAHDLIKYSGPHDTLFLSDNLRVVPGAFSFTIPFNATTNVSQYLVSVGRPSANSDGIGADVFIDAPDNSESAAAALSAVRKLDIVETKYLVGDVAPFQWFNAGDFGDGTILNNDIEQLQQVIAYGLNAPPTGSDMYDALDSCCYVGRPGAGGVDISSPTGTDFQWDSNATINSIGYGDGFLTLEDLYVSFRRALDPSLTNYNRIWRGGIRIAEATTNLFRGQARAMAMPAPDQNAPKAPLNEAMAELPPHMRIYAESLRISPGESLQIPIKADITGTIPIRSLLLGMVVRPLDGASLSGPVTFTPAEGMPALFINRSRTDYDRTVAWFNTLPDLQAGTITLGTLNLTIPANATADWAYDIRFVRVEGSIGVRRIPSNGEDAILVMRNRAARPWTDGIPDEWRVRHFGSLMNILSAPEADADGDGMTTLQEFRAGTLPTDRASRLALLGRAAAERFAVSWPSVQGVLYRLESSTALTGESWTLIEDRIPGTGEQIERAPAVENPEARFYRVQVVE